MFQFAPVDQMRLGQGPTAQGIDPSQYGVDLSALSGAVGQAQAPPVAPPAVAAAQDPQPDQGFKPSAIDTILDLFGNGLMPADSAMKQRANHLQTIRDAYALTQQQILMQALRGASPDQQKAMLLNPQEEGKALASHDLDMALTGGQTRGTARGQTPFTAPTYGLDPVSGKPYAIGPTMAGGVQSGPSLGGDFKIDPTTGQVVSARTGLTGQSVGIPTKTAPGESLHSFVGGVNGQPSSVDGSNPAAGAYPFGQPPAAGQGASVPALASVAQGKFDPAAFIKSFVIPHEGGLNPHDMNGAPTKYGINQSANPGVDVPNLTPAQAAQIYGSKYVPMSGAANMPPALGAVHLDTSIINPAAAQRFLQQSGGDPSKYMDLRDAWMQHMVQNNPAAAPYAKAWAQRNADLRGIIGPPDPNGPPVQNVGQPGVGGQPLVQGAHPQILPPSDPAYASLPPGTVLQRAPTGELSALQRPEYDPGAKSTIRDHVLSSDAYKQAKASMSAYQAMVSNAGTMTGPAAYSMLDTFARAINPGAVARPTVIDTIQKNLGLPAQFVGGLESKFGKGNLPPQVRQQIIDAVVPFAQAHWDQANMLNQANTALATQHKFNPSDVTAPLESRPERVVVTPPAAQARQKGQLYVTPKGPLRWTGTGWVAPQ